jgi:phospholipase/carboxylesterase
VRPVTINGGMPMRAWYDISGQEIAQKQDEKGIRESVGFLEELITRENGRGIDHDRILIVGFSQGGAIVLAGGTRHAKPLGGIVALSTYLPIAERTDIEASAASRSTPIFMAHGSLDPTVSHALGMMSRDYLSKLGYHVDWHSYPMAHQISMEEIADLRRWMGARFKG